MDKCKYVWHKTTIIIFTCFYELIVTVQKLEIQLRVKIDSLYLTTPKHSGGEDKLAVQVQTPKHSGGADNLGSAGAVNPAVQSLQLGQRIQSSPHPSGNTEQRPGENSLWAWKTDTESKTPQEQ